MIPTHRPGPVGALMDEYECAVGELVRVLEGLSVESFERECNPAGASEGLGSIRAIVGHIASAGFGYSEMLRIAWGLPRIDRPRGDVPLEQAPARLRAMLDHMILTLEGRWELSEQESDAMQIRSRWGPVYDFEQLFEHAIVHVLRHRRQIERLSAGG